MLTPTSSQYQLALYQIDSMRKDGKFEASDGSIPEGQGIVMAHLNECHELVEMVSLDFYLCTPVPRTVVDSVPITVINS